MVGAPLNGLVGRFLPVAYQHHPGVAPETALASFRRNHTVLDPSGIKLLFGSSVVVVSTTPIAWMYPTSKSLLIGNPLQKRGKLLLFVV